MDLYSDAACRKILRVYLALAVLSGAVSLLATLARYRWTALATSVAALALWAGACVLQHALERYPDRGEDE